MQEGGISIGEFIYYTEEQKERANAVQIAEILCREGEQMERSGHEWRWKRHKSVTFHGNKWYRHSQKAGSYAIDFMQEFFGMDFPEAVCYLLNGEQGEVVQRNKKAGQKHSQEKMTGGTEKCNKRKESASHNERLTEAQADKTETFCSRGNQEQLEEPVRKPLHVPERNENMKRVYAYLMQKRFISREILSFFARQGTLYECKEHHNIIFAGLDKEGNIRHIHKKGTCSEGESFRINEEGSHPAFGFGYDGNSGKLYVFEAPIDFLSFLTLYPKNWQENSYIVLNGVAEHAILQKLSDYPNLHTVILCLDHDAAGMEACGRIKEILVREAADRTLTVKMLQSEYKDWNEDLKAQNGIEPIPEQEHPKILECASWIEVMKELCQDMDIKYATKEYLIHYYKEIYDSLKDGLSKENIETAFDGDALLLSGIAVKCVERFGKEMGKETDSNTILDHLKKCYQPHKDKGNVKTKIWNLKQSFEEVMEVFDSRELSLTENKEMAAKKCMSLAMTCVQAHIFCACEEILLPKVQPWKKDTQEPNQKQKPYNAEWQKQESMKFEPDMEGGMRCSQS